MNNEEKARPPRHTGKDDVNLDHALRRKEPSPSRRKRDSSIPRTDTTAPGDSGTVPGDADVAMPAEYRDPWKKG